MSTMSRAAGHLDRPGADEYGTFYAGYVARVPAGDLVSILREQIGRTGALLDPLTPQRAGFAYAPGKWTVREVVGHLVDTERVMAYRALCIARRDETPLPGFDENAYAAAAGFDGRTLRDLLTELRLVRMATIALFDSFQDDAWLRRGTASGHPVSVRALACIIAGHELHHREILEERYGIASAAGNTR